MTPAASICLGIALSPMALVALPWIVKASLAWAAIMGML